MINAKIIGSTFVTVMVNGTTHTITQDHANYKLVLAAIKKGDDKTVESLINVAKTVETYSAGRVKVVGEKVMYGTTEVKGSVVNRILAMVRDGFDAKPMVKFLDNLMSNPSKRAVDELYGFLEATSLPITEDGCFLAYKKVADNYMDFYTGTMRNKVGDVLEMERNQVDEDKDRTCSFGLHFCSLSYLPHYHGGQGRVMIVSINPKDVVSIPSDYNNAKGRTAKYTVVGEHKDEKIEAFTSPVYTKTATPVVPSAAASVAPGKVGNPSLLGYNRGRSDASNGLPYQSNDARLTGTDATRYATAYHKGWGSIVANATSTPTPVLDTDVSDLDWYDTGFDQGRQDAVSGNPWDDTAVTGCDDIGAYEDGYSDGWYEGKRMR